MKINQKLHEFLRHCSVVLFAFVAMGIISPDDEGLLVDGCLLLDLAGSRTGGY